MHQPVRNDPLAFLFMALTAKRGKQEKLLRFRKEKLAEMR